MMVVFLFYNHFVLLYVEMVSHLFQIVFLTYQHRSQTEVQYSTVCFPAGPSEAGLSQSEREESWRDVPARLWLEHEWTKSRSTRGILQVFRSFIFEVKTL